MARSSPSAVQAAALVAEDPAFTALVRHLGPPVLREQLRRPDVWPADDLGVRNGYAIVHGLAAAPRPRELIALGERYRPFGSTAAWYCWRANDTVLPQW